MKIKLNKYIFASFCLVWVCNWVGWNQGLCEATMGYGADFERFLVAPCLVKWRKSGHLDDGRLRLFFLGLGGWLRCSHAGQFWWGGEWPKASCRQWFNNIIDFLVFIEISFTRTINWKQTCPYLAGFAVGDGNAVRYQEFTKSY